MSFNGPLTRTVADAALMFQTMVGPDDRDPLSLPDTGEDFSAAVQGEVRLKGLRVAWTPDLRMVPVEPVVQEICAGAVRVFADLRRAISKKTVPIVVGRTSSSACSTPTCVRPRWGTMPKTCAAAHDGPAPRPWRLEQGRALSLRDVGQGRDSPHRALRACAAVLRDAYDSLLAAHHRRHRHMPRMGGIRRRWQGRPMPARRNEILLLTYASSVTGQPAISLVPAGWTGQRARPSVCRSSGVPAC